MASAQTAISIFANIHKRHLKSAGYKKTGARSERSANGLHQAVVCFSSRFNVPGQVRFTIELRLGDEELFNLLRPGVPYPGLVETIQPILSWRLNDPTTGHEIWWNLNALSDAAAVEEEIGDLLQQQALPALDRAQSLGGIVGLSAEKGLTQGYRAQSWALFRLGQLAEAAAVLSTAHEDARHENARGAIQHWADRLAALGMPQPSQ